ncbi:hypothetical protein [Methylobacterium oxalidis]|uniref:hypothetical protein n=1 Tax=Methylobacterium oxalidis TaxID=944322 RepID=UPI003314B2F5
MLSQAFRDLLVVTATQVLGNAATARNCFETVRPGTWDRLVPMNSTLYGAVGAIVEAAVQERWILLLAMHLAGAFPARAEFNAIVAELARATPLGTVADPFEEVLLEGDRPFVNRRGLRRHLLNLMDPAGSSVLLVDGQPQTGKTFSFYLINHVAPKKGFTVNRFRMSRLPAPDDLATEILGRMGVDMTVPPIGNASAERWAEKLAGVVARTIEEKKVQRLFVFDEFSDTVLPDGTVSLIIRLATYADEELRPWLRIVLTHFRDPMPSELEDVVLRDDATPFANLDMVAALMQVAQARRWNVSQQTVVDTVERFHSEGARTLNERFKFMRSLLQTLAASS